MGVMTGPQLSVGNGSCHHQDRLCEGETAWGMEKGGGFRLPAKNPTQMGASGVAGAQERAAGLGVATAWLGLKLCAQTR